MSQVHRDPFDSPLPDTPVVTRTPEQDRKDLDALEDILADLDLHLGSNRQAADAIARIDGRYQPGLVGGFARTVETQVNAAWRTLDALNATLLQLRVHLATEETRRDRAVKLALLSEEA